MNRSIAQAHERTVAQRFEVKYMISEVHAHAIADFIYPYTTPDPHAAEYPVTSLYFDSPSLELYWSSETGEKNRHKLRIRSYGDDPQQPIFFEIKRRIDRVVKKHRAPVLRTFVPDLLDGAPITPGVMTKPEDTSAMAALLRFRSTMDALSANPVIAVRYMREAFVSNLEEPLRITFDRNLCYLACPTYTPEILSSQADWRYANEMSVILEIKFTDSFPSWVTQLVRRFHLVNDSFAKYVHCIKCMHAMEPPLTQPVGSKQTWIF